MLGKRALPFFILTIFSENLHFRNYPAIKLQMQIQTQMQIR
jgi:hypothetical protein